MWRFAFGDWRWYALNDTGLWQGILALLWPTKAALGREQLLKIQVDHLHMRSFNSNSVIKFRVEAKRAAHLVERLNQHFASQPEKSIHSQEFNLFFINVPENYSIWNNSNSKVVEWLQELGCKTSGIAIWSNWSIEIPSNQE
jgi:hypothetical protein